MDDHDVAVKRNTAGTTRERQDTVSGKCSKRTKYAMASVTTENGSAISNGLPFSVPIQSTTTPLDSPSLLTNSTATTHQGSTPNGTVEGITNTKLDAVKNQLPLSSGVQDRQASSPVRTSASGESSFFTSTTGDSGEDEDDCTSSFSGSSNEQEIGYAYYPALFGATGSMVSQPLLPNDFIVAVDDYLPFPGERNSSSHQPLRGRSTIPPSFYPPHLVSNIVAIYQEQEWDRQREMALEKQSDSVASQEEDSKPPAFSASSEGNEHDDGKDGGVWL